MSQNTNDPTERILDKLDKIDDRLNDIDKTLVKNTASLEEHMRRTDLLEKAQSDLQIQIKPLMNVHTTVITIAKIVGFIGIVAGILKLFL